MNKLFCKENKRTRYWSIIKNGLVQCDLCPRHCRLSEGQRGFCFVRSCLNGEVVSTTYGRSSGFCIDPIEKKPLYHFLPGTPVLSFGTAGCNLSCKFCQNWDITKSRERDRTCYMATPEQIANMAKQHRCNSVAFTYNDPVVFLEYAIDVAKACHAKGVKTVAVTAGYIEEKPREEFFSHIDAANVDLKAFNESFYEKLCGAKLSKILDTLLYIKHETKVWLEITNLLIPNENDAESEIREMSKWIKENLGQNVPIHFSAFHPDYKMQQKSTTPLEVLRRARDIALGIGLKYVYMGNVIDDSGSTTFCSSCRARLIQRKGYKLTRYSLSSESCCPQCGEVCQGLFNN